MFSSSASGEPSSTRKFICTPMTASAKHGNRSAATSPSTTQGDARARGGDNPSELGDQEHSDQQTDKSRYRTQRLHERPKCPSQTANYELCKYRCRASTHQLCNAPAGPVLPVSSCQHRAGGGSLRASRGREEHSAHIPGRMVCSELMCINVKL